MTKTRLILFVLTILVVGLIGLFGILYARGYRFDIKSFRFTPSGLLVVKSDPTGAQIFVNGDLRSASDATIALSPGTYDVSLRKDGYLAWNKRLTIDKEVVITAIVNLFRQAPSLTAVTFDGSVNPTPSSDLTRIAYAVLPSTELGQDDKAGIWIIETSELPLGFSRDPRRITDGDFTDASWVFSPDSRQLLVSTKSGAVYLIDAGTYTPQNQRVNIASKKEATLKDWGTQRKAKLDAQLRSLPADLVEILNHQATGIVFSPDETKILYTASGSATIADNLIKELPGSSTQKQERTIETGKIYIYDIKEDRNFRVGEENQIIRWFPTSRNLVLTEEGKVTVMDYDGTNRQVVYSGSYIFPHAYPYANTNKLLILTNLGSTGTVYNLYSLTLK